MSTFLECKGWRDFGKQKDGGGFLKHCCFSGAQESSQVQYCLWRAEFRGGDAEKRQEGKITKGHKEILL